jgi:Copper type II ascorbate-dependent monooxygenase, C-terminal domain
VHRRPAREHRGRGDERIQHRPVRRVAQSDPVNCTPFAGLALGTDIPIVFANKQSENWAFPTGIAVAIPANQMIKIEGHYINTTANDLQGTGTVSFDTVPASSAPAFQAAGFDFFGTTNITIPPNSTFSTGPLFQPGIAGTHLISITTHQHRLGTDAQVWASAQEGDTATQITNDTDWSNPSWRLIAPQFDFDGTNGLTYQCDWTNTTDQTVGFGESALDEMCFVGGYYYPSQGLNLCIDGQCHVRQ